VVSKNIGKRLLWSTFNVARTLKQHIVYLSILLAVGLIFFAEFIKMSSEQEKVKLVSMVGEIDTAIDTVIDGLNFLTQDVPEDVVVWLNNSIWTVQNQLNLLVANAASGFTRPIEQISQGIENSINQVVVWAKQQTNNNAAWTPVVIPDLTISPPPLLNWAPALPNLDLSAAKIPSRDFSVEQAMEPFIDKVFDVPGLIAWYLEAIGITLLAYSGSRILLALFIPWFPMLNCTGIEKVAKCFSLTTKAITNVTIKLQKPWIHLPLIIGLVLTLVISLLLFAAIDEAREEVLQPLADCDMYIKEVLNLVNNFTLAIPQQVKTFIDNYSNEMQNFASVTANDGIDQVKSLMTNNFRGIASALNGPLISLSLPTINIPDNMDETVSKVLNVPTQFIPEMPLIDLSALLLPASIAGVQQAIAPWVDDRFTEFVQVATVLLFISIGLIVIPGIALCGTFIEPFIPHQVNEFFLHPDYVDAAGATPSKGGKNDLPVSEPSLVEKGQKSDLEELKDKDGNTYYFNSSTGVTSWEKPTS